VVFPLDPCPVTEHVSRVLSMGPATQFREPVVKFAVRTMPGNLAWRARATECGQHQRVHPAELPLTVLPQHYRRVSVIRNPRLEEKFPATASRRLSQNAPDTAPVTDLVQALIPGYRQPAFGILVHSRTRTPTVFAVRPGRCPGRHDRAVRTYSTWSAREKVL
jgi:hypothetical protein